MTMRHNLVDAPAHTALGHQQSRQHVTSSAIQRVLLRLPTVIEDREALAGNTLRSFPKALRDALRRVTSAVENRVPYDHVRLVFVNSRLS